MAIVTSYSIPPLGGNILSMTPADSRVSSSVAQSWGVVSYGMTTPPSTGWTGYAANQDIFDVSTTLGSGSIELVSWPGNMNDQGIDATSDLISGTNVGAWPGNSNGSTVYTIPTDEHNDSVISADNPESNQSAALIEWNHFPFPAATPAPATKPRDMSRFQKAYSFTRQQPVRIRLFRR